MALRFEYSGDKKITALQSDSENNGIWMAFAKNTDNEVVIQRQSSFNPNQTFYRFTRSVDSVNDMAIDDSFLYLAYSDENLLGEIFSLNNPLTTFITISIPSGISEKPVAVNVNGDDLFFLLPGSASGENAKILKYDIDGIFIETIDLIKTGITITDASTMTISDIGDIWISTNTDPISQVRVFELSGGGYDFTVTL